MPASDRPPPPRRKKRARPNAGAPAASRAPNASGASRARAARGAIRDRLGRLTPRARAFVWGAATLAGTLALAVAGLLLGYGGWHGKGARTLEIDWPAGLSPEDAAALLAEKGLVESRDTMAVFLRATGGTAEFVPGPHLLFEGATPWEIRRMLARSFFRPMARVTIPEGYNRFDIAARLEKLHVAGRRAFLAQSADPALLAELGVSAPGVTSVESAEGYLFPATYDFGVDSDAREIVRRLVAESDRRWEAASARHPDALAKLSAQLGWGRREVLIVASMIEKEAAVDEDRPLIASVFVNRLTDPDFKPKRLQSDPTSAYGCVAFPDEAPSCASFAGKPTPAVNKDPLNRYSTYAHVGLPPGPIANPGQKSIEAALAPPATRYFYFVAAGGGRHAFSETLDAHNDAVHRDAGRAP
jgi:UPF0755 protein